MSVMIEREAADVMEADLPVSALLIKPDGIEHYRGPLDLVALQGLVGGFVEIFNVPGLDRLPSVDCWVNEEGKFRGLASNATGTALLLRAGGMRDDWVAGPLIVTGTVDEHGNTTPVPGEWVDEFPETA